MSREKGKVFKGEGREKGVHQGGVCRNIHLTVLYFFLPPTLDGTFLAFREREKNLTKQNRVGESV